MLRYLLALITWLHVWHPRLAFAANSSQASTTAPTSQANQAVPPGKSGYEDIIGLLGSNGSVQTAADYLRITHQSYQPKLSTSQCKRGLAYTGANLRLRKFCEKLINGDKVSVGVIGGSISWGFYQERGVNDWFAIFSNWLKYAFPSATVKQRNGCVPATTAEYVSMCLSRFVDSDVDVIFVEYSVNDGFQDISINNHRTQAFERLIRKLMKLPNQPAVVVMNALDQAVKAAQAPFYWSVQDHYGALCQYYGLPWLSVRDAIWHEVMADTPGYTAPEIYPPVEQTLQRHPSELGHKYMADIAVSMMQQAYVEYLLEPIDLNDTWVQKLMEMPKPMFEKNYESENLACMIGADLKGAVVNSTDWSWVNEGSEEKPKWGYATDKEGAELVILLDTSIKDPQDGQKTTRPTAAAVVNSTAPRVQNKIAPDNPQEGGSMSAGLQETSKGTSASESRHEAPGSIKASSSSSSSIASTHRDASSGPTGEEPQAERTAWEAHKRIKEQRALQATASGTSAAPLGPDQQLLQETADKEVHHTTTGTTAQEPGPGAEGLTPEQFADQEAAQAQQEEEMRTNLEREYQAAQSGDMIVWVGYKKTWKNGGQANLSCSGECTCNPVQVNAHHKWRTTQSFMAKLYTQQVAACSITVTVLNTTQSGGHHFKVSGVMITRRIPEYDGGDHTDVLLLNAIEGQDYKG